MLKLKETLILTSLCIGGLLLVKYQKSAVTQPSDLLKSPQQVVFSFSPKNDDKTKSNQQSQPEVLTHKEKPENLENIILTESLNLNSLDASPEQTELRLKQIALKLHSTDLTKLTEYAISPAVDFNQRLISTYLLTLAGVKAQNELIRIFQTPAKILNENQPVHSIGEIEQKNEFTIRTMALEAIELNSHNAGLPLDLKPNLKNNYLNGLLKTVLLGKQLKKPLLKQFIDKNLNAAESKI